MYADQEKYWQQRSKTAWMREGDKNTTLFYAKAANQACVNQVNGLTYSNGAWRKARLIWRKL